MNGYHCLPVFPLPLDAKLAQQQADAQQRITPESPAISIMTDLRHVQAAIISSGSTLQEANSQMMARGVKLLFVETSQDELAGIITYKDLMGEKPILFSRQNREQRSHIQVRDIMTPRNQLEVMMLSDILHARVGQVVDTLTKAGRQHALVLNSDDKTICGIFSATEISRRAGIEIESSGMALTFAEMEAQLAQLAN
ncbi:MAG TPA: CBS domain-containing protein [Burkholderiales bacterium]|nr:CBS domain-containing protein [Pseudomonadota bacterium]HVC48562.1 CBS domain-containing protein [Burkholderiales bacterium]